MHHDAAPTQPAARSCATFSTFAGLAARQEGFGARVGQCLRPALASCAVTAWASRSLTALTRGFDELETSL